MASGCGYRDEPYMTSSLISLTFHNLTYDAAVIDWSYMIRSFRSQETEVLVADVEVPRFRSFERIARRKLMYLHRARSLPDLQVPPGNRLEALKGERKGQHTYPHP